MKRENTRVPTFFDLETSTKNTGEGAIGKNKASPWCEKNKIVWSGVRVGDGQVSIERCDGVQQPVVLLDAIAKAEVLVAQNISFDLSYVYAKYGALSVLIKNETSIWDTQLAEYLLSGQEMKWASLDQLSALYGGVIKDDRMKEYWDNGVSTEDIPEEEIIPYLRHDVDNLATIYYKQVEDAKEKEHAPINTIADARQTNDHHHGM